MEFFSPYFPVTALSSLDQSSWLLGSTISRSLGHLYGPRSSDISAESPAPALSRFSRWVWWFSEERKRKFLSYVTHERSTSHLGYVSSIILFTLKNVNENWPSLNWDSCWTLWNFICNVKYLQTSFTLPSNQFHQREFYIQMSKIKDWLLTQGTKNERKWRELIKVSAWKAKDFKIAMANHSTWLRMVKIPKMAITYWKNGENQELWFIVDGIQNSTGLLKDRTREWKPTPVFLPWESHG